MKITRKMLDKYDNIDELIRDIPDIKTYNIHEVMDTEEELFATGCHCIVKNSLGLLRLEGSTIENHWLDVYMSKSYLNAKYIKLFV